MAWMEEKTDCVIINLRVIPRAAKNEIAGLLGREALKVRIQAPPVEGKANACLIRFLSGAWDVPRSRMDILSGEHGRNKRIRITQPPASLIKTLRALQNN